jgi:hypothetical protein
MKAWKTEVVEVSTGSGTRGEGYNAGFCQVMCQRSFISKKGKEGARPLDLEFTKR